MRKRTTALAALVLLPIFLLAAPLASAKKPPKPPPPPSSPADPEITFLADDGLWVMNDDGSHQSILYEDFSIFLYSPKWSGDGGSIMFVEQDPYGTNKGVLRRIDVTVVDDAPVGGSLATLVDDVEVWNGDWSPTGDVIAFIAQPNTWEDREVRLVPANGGVQETIYAASFGDRLQVLTWSPDGSEIAVIEKTENLTQGHVRVIDVATAAIVTTLELPKSDGHDEFGGISWARTQDVLAYVEHIRKTTVKGKKVRTSTVPTIHILDLATGLTMELTEGYRPAWSPDDAYLAWKGVTKYEYATGIREDLGSQAGVAPDWR